MSDGSLRQIGELGLVLRALRTLTGQITALFRALNQHPGRLRSQVEDGMRNVVATPRFLASRIADVEDDDLQAFMQVLIAELEFRKKPINSLFVEFDEEEPMWKRVEGVPELSPRGRAWLLATRGLPVEPKSEPPQ